MAFPLGRFHLAVRFPTFGILLTWVKRVPPHWADCCRAGVSPFAEREKRPRCLIRYPGLRLGGAGLTDYLATAGLCRQKHQTTIVWAVAMKCRSAIWTAIVLMVLFIISSTGFCQTDEIYYFKTNDGNVVMGVVMPSDVSEWRVRTLDGKIVKIPWDDVAIVVTGTEARNRGLITVPAKNKQEGNVIGSKGHKDEMTAGRASDDRLWKASLGARVSYPFLLLQDTTVSGVNLKYSGQPLFDLGINYFFLRQLSVEMLVGYQSMGVDVEAL